MPTETRTPNQDILEMLARIHNTIATYDTILGLPNCNNCKIAQTCKFLPKDGEFARINCPLHEKIEPVQNITVEEQEDGDSITEKNEEVPVE